MEKLHPGYDPPSRKRLANDKHSIHKFCFSADSLHLRYFGEHLTQSEWEQANNLIEEEFQDAFADSLNFICGDNLRVKEAYEKFGDHNKQKNEKIHEIPEYLWKFGTSTYEGC